MKKFVLISLLFISIGVYSQYTIIPLENEYQYIQTNGGATPKNTYYKDVNGILNAYLGTWIGSSSDNKYHYTITFSIENDISTGYNHYHDKLKTNYVITDTNGNVMEKTEIGENSPYLSSEGLSLTKKAYSFYYQGKYSLCGRKGNFIVTPIDTIKLSIVLLTGNDFSMVTQLCPNGKVEQLFPVTSLVLTKQ